MTTPALRPVASATWRERLKRVWEVDPLLCPRCGTEMIKLAAIRDPVVEVCFCRAPRKNARVLFQCHRAVEMRRTPGGRAEAISYLVAARTPIG